MKKPVPQMDLDCYFSLFIKDASGKYYYIPVRQGLTQKESRYKKGMYFLDHLTFTLKGRKL